MNATAVYALILAGLGAPVALLGPLALAHLLINRPADRDVTDPTPATGQEPTR